MFRLQKLKSGKSGERLDFKFSDLQALQVPKGWDKLSLSIVSVEKGKTLTKSGKASVRNGSCRWTDSLSESIWIAQYDDSKEDEECLIKLVVSMGSSRSGILGEATVNVVSYRSSKTAIPVSLPLKNCSYGTILQVKIQCLTPKAKLREQRWEDSGTYAKDMNVNYDDVESKSDASDSSHTRSVGSSSSNHLDSTSHTGELTRDFSFSASGSHCSFDSLDGSLGRENYSPRHHLASIINNQIGKQDSTGSQHSSPNGSFNASSRSNYSSFNSKGSASQSHFQYQKEEFNQVSHTVPSSPLRNVGPSKDLLDAAEVTIEELRVEARMWEQNARKLVTDLEKMQMKFEKQSKHQKKLEMELAESHRECDGLKQEVLQLKVLLEDSIAKQTAAENLRYDARGKDNIQKELEEEVKFQKESIASLSVQLKKTQESNIELVAILQELEDTVEKQKIEIANLSEMQSRNEGAGNDGHGLEGNNELQESQKKLESTIHFLEKSLEEKIHEIEVEQRSKDQTLMDCEAEWRGKVAVKEEENFHLERKLTESLNACKFENGDDHDLIKEIKVLKQKMEELERDCNELTEENLELLLKLKESNGHMENASLSASESEVSKMKSQICNLEGELNKKEMRIEELSSQNKNQYADLERRCADLELQLQASKDETFYLDSECSMCRARADEQEIEITALKQQLAKKEMLVEELSNDHKNQYVVLERRCSDLGLQLQASKDKMDTLNGEYCRYCARADEQETEIAALQQQLEKKEMLIEQLSIDHKNQYADLELRCADLELQLQSSKDKMCYLGGECCRYRARADELEIEIAVLQQQLDCYQQKETEAKISNSHDAVEMAKMLSELHEQILLCSANVKKQHYSPANSDRNCGNNELHVLGAADLFSQKRQAKAILKSFVQLKDLFEAKCIAHDDELREIQEVRKRMADAEEVQCRFEACDLKENTLSTSALGRESLQMESNPEVADSGKEILEKISEIEKLKSDNLFEEREVEALRRCQSELETQISNLQDEKRKLEENAELTVREGGTTPKCMENLQNEVMTLQSSLDSQVSANNVLLQKASELESSKQDLEFHLSELEKENVKLSDRICGLESELRYLTDQRELSCLELQHSETCAVNLREEIRRLEGQLEVQKDDMKQKLQGMREQLFESQQECEDLKMANSNFRTTAENLVEECNLLQKSNGELRKEKMELHKHFILLEAEVRESENIFSGMHKDVEALEAKYTLMLEEFASKEKALSLEIDSLLCENRKLLEQLVTEGSLLNQMYLEKTAMVDNFQQEITHLTEQIFAIDDEKGRAASEAMLDNSRLRAENGMLKVSLKEVQVKLKCSESKLSTTQIELEEKLLGLGNDLAASKKNLEIMKADHEKILELLEEVKSKEAKCKRTVRGLELKLKASEYRRLEVAEENSNLKVQIQKTVHLHDEISALNKSRNEVKFENQRLKASSQMLSEDIEGLKAEKILSVQKMADMQKTVSELENFRRSNTAIEDKVLRLEGDLTAREGFCTQNAELKNELARVKIAVSEFQRKIRQLEEEKQECLRRAQACGEELKQGKEAKKDQIGSSEARLSLSPVSNETCTSAPDEPKHLQSQDLGDCAGGEGLVLIPQGVR